MRLPREPPFDLFVCVLFCAVSLGIGVYLCMCARLEAVWDGWVIYDLILVISFLLVSIVCLWLMWLVRVWRVRVCGDVLLCPPYDVQLPDGRYIAIRNPLAVGLIVFFVSQTFLVWLTFVAFDLRIYFRVVSDTSGRIRFGAEIFWVRWIIGLVFVVVVGWLLYQLLVALFMALIPWDLVVGWLLGFWWLWWFAMVLQVITMLTVAVYGQYMVNRLVFRAGTLVLEGPESSAPDMPHGNAGTSLLTSSMAISA